MIKLGWFKNLKFMGSLCYVCLLNLTSFVSKIHITFVNYPIQGLTFIVHFLMDKNTIGLFLECSLLTAVDKE